MLQRKQTIYLALAFICLVLLLVFPIFSISAERAGLTYSGAFGAYGMTGSEGESVEFPLFILIIVLALFTSFSIMSYKNRKRQLVVCRINLILHILMVLSFIGIYYMGKSTVLEDLEKRAFSNTAFTLDIGFYLAAATIPFLILAIRGIKQDEALLKSIDRIR